MAAVGPQLADFFAPQSTTDAICLNADAFDAIDCLPTQSVDLVLTSPPYWGLRTYGFKHNWDIGKRWQKEGHTLDETPAFDWYRLNGGILGLEPTPEWFVAHLADILHKFWRVLKPSGSMWINLGDTYFARWASIRDEGRQGLAGDKRIRRKTPMGGFRQEKNLLLVPSRFAIELQNRRWILRNDLIWFKPNIPPRADGDRLRLAHEHFFHFVKRPKEGRARYFYDSSKVEAGGLDVVTVNVRPGEDGHSATFPRELIAPRIESSCPVGGVVVDPFAGTGRTIQEAVRLNRRGVAIELATKYQSRLNVVLGERWCPSQRSDRSVSLKAVASISNVGGSASISQDHRVQPATPSNSG